MKYAIKYYNSVVFIFISDLVFNFGFRKLLIKKLFDIDRNESVINSDNYYNATMIDNIFVYTNKLIVLTTFCFSVALLFSKSDSINKPLVILISAICILFIFVAIATGNLV